MRYEPSNNQIIVTGIKIYQPLFEAFTGCLAGLFLAPEETWLGEGGRNQFSYVRDLRFSGLGKSLFTERTGCDQFIG